jgi:hypothetical protein
MAVKEEKETKYEKHGCKFKNEAECEEELDDEGGKSFEEAESEELDDPIEEEEDMDTDAIESS